MIVPNIAWGMKGMEGPSLFVSVTFLLPCIPLHFKVNASYGVHKKMSHFDNFQHLDPNLTCHDGYLKMCCRENLQYTMIYVPIHHYVMEFMHK
jgi:hypothetical protein